MSLIIFIILIVVIFGVCIVFDSHGGIASTHTVKHFFVKNRRGFVCKNGTVWEFRM